MAAQEIAAGEQMTSQEQKDFFRYCKAPILEIEVLLDTNESLTEFKNKIQEQLNILKKFGSSQQEKWDAFQKIRSTIDDYPEQHSNLKEKDRNVLLSIWNMLNYAENYERNIRPVIKKENYKYNITSVMQIEVLLDFCESLAELKEKIEGQINILKNSSSSPNMVRNACERINSKILNLAQFHANLEGKEFDFNYNPEDKKLPRTNFEVLQTIWGILHYVKGHLSNQESSHTQNFFLQVGKEPSTDDKSNTFGLKK